MFSWKLVLEKGGENVLEVETAERKDIDSVDVERR